jgi:hypothetical protein
MVGKPHLTALEPDIVPTQPHASGVDPQCSAPALLLSANLYLRSTVDLAL